MRRVLPIILLLALVVLGIRLVTLEPRSREQNLDGRGMSVHFIDVGQGDCTLIRTPDGRNVLIDAGDEDSADHVIRYLESNGVQRIDLLVISHPHPGQIGGLPKVLDKFGVSCIVGADWHCESPIYEQVLLKLEERKIDHKFIGRDPTPIASTDVGIDLFRTQHLYGGDDTALDNGSIVAYVKYMNVGVLLPGDIRMDGESDLLGARRDIQSAILKVSHHGSDDSTSNELLQVAKPVYAVISVGHDNPDGYPSSTILRRLDAAGAKVYRTDTDRSVVFRTDGERIRVAAER